MAMALVFTLTGAAFKVGFSRIDGSKKIFLSKKIGDNR